MPIIIKDNIATMDKMNNTAGSFALLGAKVPKDAGVAAKLRAAGAIILGKANLSEWANFRSSNSTNGWSAYGGQTKGVYYPQQDPSGSSSGSGVASALGLALAALGTETSGSILSPAGVSNLVGIKPTVGLTSRALVIPISQRQDTVGPMARTVKDAGTSFSHPSRMFHELLLKKHFLYRGVYSSAEMLTPTCTIAYLLQAIVGKDPDDNYTSAIPFSVLPDYVAACNYSSLRGKRFGIPRNIIYDQSGDEPVLAAFEAAIKTIKRAGGIIIDNTNITAYALDQYFNGNSSITVLEADFISDLPGGYLSKLTYNPQNVTNVADVRNFTQTVALEDYPDRDTAVWDEALALGFGNTDPRFWNAYQINLEIAGPQGILGLLANYSLDALVIPTDFAPGLLVDFRALPSQ